MVSVVAAPLTKIGFRRDLKLFFGALVGFLVLLILAVLMLLRRDLIRLEEVYQRHWETVARIVADDIGNRWTKGGDVEGALTYHRSKYDIVQIEARDARGARRVVSGFPAVEPTFHRVEQPFHGGTVALWFDAGTLHSSNRTFRWVAVTCILASIFSAILLALYLPKIVRPIEQMLDDAGVLREKATGVDESHYLIETFRESIATLKRQESELRDLHEREKTRADELALVSATLTRNLTSGFLSLDADGTPIEMNAAGREILGNDIPAPFRELIEDGHRSRVAINRREVEWDGHCLGVTMVPLFAADGRFLGSLVLFTDLAEVRSLESRVRELEALARLGEMSAGIAHEFRNSLSTILGYLKLAQKQDLADGVRTKLQHTEREAAALSGAVDALLNFARPMQLETDSVDLHRIASDTVDRIRAASDSIRFDVRGASTVISGDPRLLTRAVENVLRNAVDAIREKNEPGSITVDVTPTPAPTLVVTDTGVGLDPHDSARLVLPFQSTKPTGFGLGLALTKKIVLLHGGEITLTGEKGTGATVTMRFPLPSPLLPSSRGEGAAGG